MGVNFILARQPRATWQDEPCSDRRSRKRRTEADADGSKLIYFLGGDGTPVKIGFSVDPDARRRNLQSAHWCRLSVLATVVGTEADEKAYHVRFAAHRLEGEWFARCPEIEAEIARLKAEAEV